MEDSRKAFVWAALRPVDSGSSAGRGAGWVQVVWVGRGPGAVGVLSVIENAYECGSLGSLVPTRSVSVPADEEVQIWGGTLPTKGA
jgi:hypothetical protein